MPIPGYPAVSDLAKKLQKAKDTPDSVSILPVGQQNQILEPKTEVVPDNSNLDLESKREQEKRQQAREQEFVNFSNDLQAGVEKRRQILQSHIKDRKVLTKEAASNMRDMNIDQFNMTVDALEIRRMAQTKLQSQLNKVNRINQTIGNYSKRIDPDFFWKRRTSGSQNAIIETLAGLAGTAVDPVALMSTLQADINQEVEVQRSNIQTDIALLTEKRDAEMNMYQTMKQVYDDELVIETSIAAAYKERAQDELKRAAFMLKEGEEQTNLLLAVEELGKSALDDKLKINQMLSDDYNRELTREASERETKRKDQRYRLDVAKFNLDVAKRKAGQAETLQEKKRQEKKDKLEEEKHQFTIDKDLRERSSDISDNRESWVKRAMDPETFNKLGVGGQPLSKEELEKITQDKEAFYPKSKEALNTYNAEEKDHLKGLYLANRMYKLYEEAFSDTGLARSIAKRFPGKQKAINDAIKAQFKQMVGAIRKDIVGGGQLSDTERPYIEKALNIMDNEDFWRPKNREAALKKIKEMISRIQTSNNQAYKRAYQRTGNPGYSKVYNVIFNTKYKNEADRAHQAIEDFLKSYEE